MILVWRPEDVSDLFYDTWSIFNATIIENALTSFLSRVFNGRGGAHTKITELFGTFSKSSKRMKVAFSIERGQNANTASSSVDILTKVKVPTNSISFP